MYPPMGNLPGLIDRRQILRADATLPAAGEYDVNGIFTTDFEYLTLFIEYIEGAVAGSLELMIEFSPYSVDQAGIENWFQDNAYSVGAVAPGVVTDSEVQGEIVSFEPVGVARENFVIQANLNRTMERMRVSVREAGAVGTPGDCKITTVLG